MTYFAIQSFLPNGNPETLVGPSYLGTRGFGPLRFALLFTDRALAEAKANEAASDWYRADAHRRVRRVDVVEYTAELRPTQCIISQREAV